MTIELYNGDCLEAMREMPDNAFDLAIVDPPYGINIADWDNLIPPQEYFNELKRVSKNQIIWGANYFNLPHSQAWICWDKTFKYSQKLNIGEFELAWTSFDHKAVFCRYTYCGNFFGWDNPRADYNKPENIHPTQKPVALYTWLLDKYAKQGDRILDTHLGSGSIAIACHNLGYDLVGYELDEDYYEAACNRLAEHQKQLRLF